MRCAVLAIALVGCGGHRHGTPLPDKSKLFVEVYADGSYEDALNAGAKQGLGSVGYARLVDGRGDIELQVEVANLDVIGNTTQCKVKILVIRLPQHDLLGIADGTARAGGTHDAAADDCAAKLTATLIRGRVRTLLQRQFNAKR